MSLQSIRRTNKYSYPNASGAPKTPSVPKDSGLKPQPQVKLVSKNTTDLKSALPTQTILRPESSDLKHSHSSTTEDSKKPNLLQSNVTVLSSKNSGQVEESTISKKEIPKPVDVKASQPVKKDEVLSHSSSDLKAELSVDTAKENLLKILKGQKQRNDPETASDKSRDSLQNLLSSLKKK